MDEKSSRKELSLEDMEQVSGAASLQDLMMRIRRSGKAPALKELLQTQGKAAAAAQCCAEFPDQCGLCAAAVSML